MLAQGDDIGIVTTAGSFLRVSVNGGAVSVGLASKRGSDADTAVDDFFQVLKDEVTQYEAQELQKQLEADQAETAAQEAEDSSDSVTAVDGTAAEPIEPTSASARVIAFARGKATDAVSSVRGTLVATLSDIKAVSMLVVRHLPSFRVLIAWLVSFSIVFALAAAIGWKKGFDSRDPVKQPEYIDMLSKKNEELKKLNASFKDVKGELEAEKNTVNELRPYKDEYDQKKAELDQRQADLDNRSSTLDSREASIEQRENSMSSSSNASSSSGTQAGTSSGASSGGGYYKNCAAARAAGAAPLYRGQSGYRSELDRDGDGIACEWS